MGILNITMQPTGLVGVNPGIIYINTTNTVDEVTTPGFLNPSKELGYFFDNSQMALVNTTTGTLFASVNVDTNGNVNLVSLTSPGTVKAETTSVNNHLVAYSGTTGELIKDSGIDYNTVVRNDILNDLSYTVTGSTPGFGAPLNSTVTSTNADLANAQLSSYYSEITLNGMSNAEIFSFRADATMTGISSTANSFLSTFYGQIELEGTQIDQTTIALFLGNFVGEPFAVPNAENIYHVFTKNATSLVPNAYDRRDGDATYFGVYANDTPSPQFYVTAGTGSGSAGKDSNCNAPFVITLTIGGNPCYIPVFTENSN